MRDKTQSCLLSITCTYLHVHTHRRTHRHTHTHVLKEERHYFVESGSILPLIPHFLLWLSILTLIKRTSTHLVEHAPSPLFLPDALMDAWNGILGDAPAGGMTTVACVNSSCKLPQNISTLLKYIQHCFQWQQNAVGKGESLRCCWHKFSLSTPIKWLLYHSWSCATHKHLLLGPGLFPLKNSGMVLHNVLIVFWSGCWQMAKAARLGYVPSMVCNTCYWCAKGSGPWKWPQKLQTSDPNILIHLENNTE